MTSKLGSIVDGVRSAKRGESWLDLTGASNQPVTSAMLRGGRMTKQNGVATSYSPELGVSVMVGNAQSEGGLLSRALAALRWGAAPAAIAASGLVGATPAMAQAQDACVETAPGSGVFVCEDNGARATTTQSVSAGKTFVSIEDGFEVDTTGVSGDGLRLIGTDGTLVVEQVSGSSSITGDTGISAQTLPVVSASARASGALRLTTAGDVTGNTQEAIFARSQMLGLSIDTTASSLFGATSGIRAISFGTQGTEPGASRAVTIQTGNVYGRLLYGIRAETSRGVTDLIINTTAGSVSSDNNGIQVDHQGVGELSITTADVTSARFTGINFDATNASQVNVNTTAGSVNGRQYGIRARNNGSGSLTITTGDVNAGSRDGINANAYGTDVAIDSSAGTINANTWGILTRNYGTGALAVTTGDVSGTAGDGVSARGFGSTLTIDTSAGTITGGAAGIVAEHYGSGAAMITVNDVTGNGSVGIRAISTQATAAITVRGSSGDIVGNTDGIYTRTAGSDITAENLDSVTGQNGDGLDLGSAGGAVTVSDIGTITGNLGAGIRIDSQGGDISIQGVGTVGGVTGTSGSGIEANASIFGTDGNINIGDIAAIGAVSGSTNGIYARTAGTGSITIVASGDVTGGNAGILAVTYDTGAISIDSTGVSVSGGFGNGVQAANINGSGSINIMTGDVSSTYGNGVYVGAYSGDTVIDTTGGAITAGSNGITARNGIGAASMSILSGDITATNFGLYARSQTGDLTVDTTAGDINAGSFAVVVLSDNGDATSLTTGNVTSTYGSGVFARSRGNSTSLTVDTTAGSIQGQVSGVVARQEGTGSLSVTTSDTNATVYSGIFALTYGTDASVDSTAGTTSGGNFGVYAINRGTGSLTITTADAIGTNFDGIYASNQGGSTDLTIDTMGGSVSGGRHGIYARDYGTGALAITTGDATGYGLDGVRGRKVGGTSLSIDTTSGSVSGSNAGITATLDNGSGAVSVLTGAVTATSGMGVFVTNSYSGTDLTIDTTGGPVVGSMPGVYARNDGTGSTSVTTADVTGQAFDGVDVRAQGTDVSVDTSLGTVVGQQSGVSVAHQGTGFVDVTTADVTGSYAVGVAVTTAGSGLSVDTSAGSVVGGNNGLSITNNGYGSTNITTANVSGNGFYGILVNTGGYAGDIAIDSSAGSVSGANTGILVRQDGYGAVSITSADVSGANQYGIYAFTIGTGLTLDTAAGTVTGGFNGIDVRNSGYGAATITTGSVTGYGNYGIAATSYATAGDLTIDSSAGAVSGNYTGVQARQYGQGALSITTADSTGDFGRGIYGYLGGASTGNLTIDSSAGSVQGRFGGIYAVNFGVGDTVITTGAVSGGFGNGIDLNSFGTNATIDSSAGAVSGTVGINARNYGTGQLAITTGDVTSSGGDGVFASNDGTDLVIDTSAGSVTGAYNGITARSYGYYSTDLSITTSYVDGQNGSGIYAVQYGANGNLTIDSSTGAVSGSVNGIFARNYGSGNLSITASYVSGSSFDGIYARNDGTDLTVDTSAGSVTAVFEGIEARNNGTGTLTVISGDISTSAFDGIFAQNYGTDTIINSTAGSIAGARLGIFALHNGTGALSIRTANVTGGSSIGVYGGTTASATDLVIDSSAGRVSGDTNGVDARHRGSGYASITTSDVTSVNGTAVYASNSAYGTDLSFDTSAGSVNAPGYGIDARQYGTGALSITTADVTSTNTRAIRAENSAAGTDLTIDSSAGSVSGGDDGIYARNAGSGAVRVTTGDVTGVSGEGVQVRSFGTDIDIDTSAGSVTGGNNGIIVSGDYISGAISVVTADVTGQTQTGVAVSGSGTDILVDTTAGTVTGQFAGVNVTNGGTGTTAIATGDVIGAVGPGVQAFTMAGDVSVDTSEGSVSGANGGVIVINVGSGAASVTTADVDGGGSVGIAVTNMPTNGATDLTIDSTAGTVTGANNGIFANNNSSGSTTIRSATVSGGTENGIYAISRGTTLTIDTSDGSVTGDRRGILALHSGSGAASITTGDVAGAIGDGVLLLAYSTATDVTVDTSAGSVSGPYDAVEVINNGTGSTTIITADATSTIDDGVYVRGDGTDVSVDTTAGTVTGGTEGIVALNNGSGVLSVKSANVIGTTGAGISAFNSASGSDLSIDTSAGAVTGASNGIAAMQMGTGDVSLTTADVSGTAQYGIYLNAGAGSTSVNIDSTAGAVQGGMRGINVANFGSGPLSIATGDVTGLAGNAIGAFNAATATDLDIDTSAGSVSGGDNGIVATNFGTGSLSLSTADVAADAGDAILATNSADSYELAIDTSAGTVTGALQGIDARQYGAGALTITVNDVTGLTAEAIRAISTQMSAHVTVQGSSGDVTGATDGIKVVTGGADITVDNLDSVTGQAGDGLDLVSAGGSITVNDIGAVTGTGGNGILADSDGGAITIDAVGLAGGVTGTAGAGILADATGGTGGAIAIGTTDAIGDVTGSTNAITALSDGAGSIAIDTSAGTATGNDNGVYALNTGSGDTSIVTADAIGMANAAILANTAGSGLSIDSTAGTIMGQIGGVFAANTGSGETEITTADVMSAAGIGIFAQTSGSDLTIDSSAGTVIGADDGIIAESTGSGSTLITTADVTGVAGTGIGVAAAGSDTNVDTTAGTVMGGLDGILLDHTGTGSVMLTTGTTAGATGFGIIAETSGLDLTIDTTVGLIDGGTGGVDADNTGAGTTTITTGDVTGVTGEALDVVHSGTDLIVNTSAGTVVGGAIGIATENNGTGSTTITAGDVRGMTEAAIDASNGMTASDLTINATGTTMGELVGILATNDGTGTTTIVNDGIVMATSGEALRIVGAGSSVTNNGTLLGFVTLGDGDDTLTNNGLFSAEGDSDFGLGSDLFTNSSDFIVASGGSVAINGLEIFANTALVSLADGAIGNNLTVSGDFAGSGNSMLGLDVDFSASAADVLTVGGAATGATTLGINVVGGTPNTLFADILVVDAGAGSSETAFTLMGGRQTIGLIEFDVAFDATSNDFFLATAPSLAAFEASNFAETARGVWQQSADAFSAQMATDRDGEGSSSSNLAGGQDSAARAWITGFGGNLDRERDVSTNVNGIANQFNLGYDQDAFGALAGVDFGSNTVRYGITGGYISSEARFAGSPNRVDYDVLTIGAYVALDTGPLFASLLAKYDTINGQLTSATGGVSSELDGSAFGVQGEVGALVGDRTGFFFEPSASLAYNNADLDGVTTTQGSFAFEEGDSLLGKIGARLGSGFSSGDTPGAIYIGARYVHEFEGEDSVIFSSGGQTATFGNLPVDDYAELTAGVALGGDDDALSGGFRGQVLVGEDVSGFGVSANLLFRF